MTTIAWDGRTLAADKQATSGGLARTVTKLFRVGDLIVAACGDLCPGMEMVEWIRQGADPAKLPAFQRTDDWVTVVTVDKAKVLRIYERGAVSFVIEDKHFASGSGRDFALGAMHMGADAKKAVEVAALFDTGTGKGVDAISLDDPA